MIGLLYLGVMLGGTIFFGLRAANENAQHIKIAEKKRQKGKNKARIYTDRLGATRSLDNGKRVSIDNLYAAESKGRDCFMYDDKGNPTRNLSEELRAERLAETIAQQDPRITVSKWKDGIPLNLIGEHGRDYFAGPQYKDIINGEIYVCRMLDIPSSISGNDHTKGIYYMDTKNGLLVREADSGKENTRKGYLGPSDEVSSKFIAFFNDKQNREGYISHSKYPDPKDCDMNGNEKDIFKKVRLSNYYCNKYAVSDIV